MIPRAFLVAAAVATSSLLSPATAWSQDYTALRIEAENFTSRNADWQLSSADSMPDDPVDPFHFNASGNSYMELLPDTRVTGDDLILQGQNFWGGPGDGPALHYNVNIPSAGRYIVWAKAYSSGTEDNGIHVGINSTQPASGAKQQWCEGKQNWTWSSAQRTEDQHCGVRKTIFLDAVSGNNTITFWAREDGFELDQFILIREDHDGSLDCYPTSADAIRCDDASGQMVNETYLPVTVLAGGNGINTPEDSDGLVDLALNITADQQNVSPGNLVNYTVNADNNDAVEAATNVIINIALDNGLQFESSGNCILSGQSVRCSIAQINAGQSASATFTASVSSTGTLFSDARVDADQNDNRISNNASRTSLTSISPTFLVEGALSITANSNVHAAGGDIIFNARIANQASQPLANAQLQVTAPNGSTLSSESDSCQITNNSCAIDLATVATGQATTTQVTLTSDSASPFSAQFQLLANADEVPTNNSASIAIAGTEARTVAPDPQTDTISMEAEQFSAASVAAVTPSSDHRAPAWNLVSANFTPAVQPDTDLPAVTNASAGGYLELLPDHRATETDAIVAGASNYNTAGDGPTLDYPIMVARPGRYYLHVRLRAQSSQDNSVHVGINNRWPQTAAAVTSCTTDGSWQWSVHTQSSGDCAAAPAAYLDIDTAGPHTIQVSGNKDGTEFDKLVMTTDTNFSPVGTGPTPIIFSNPDADLKVSASLINNSVNSGEDASLQIDITNLSDSQDALAISIAIDGIDPTQNANITGFDNCTATATGATCTLSAIAAGETISSTLAIVAPEDGIYEYSINVSSLSNDTDQQNSQTATTLKVGQKSGGSFDIVALIFLQLLILLWHGKRYFRRSRSLQTEQ